MASQVSPGIVIKERDLSNAVVIGSQQIVAAIAGSFAKGPVGEIVSVNSQRELVEIFGKPSDANAGDWYVASEFLGYGGRLAVVRAETGVANSTASGTGVLIKNLDAWESGTGSSEVFAARTPGRWGNSLKVAVVDRGADQILTLDENPDNTPVVNATVTFTSGKSGKVYSYASATRELAIVLNTPANKIAAGDTFADSDGILTFTHNGVTEAARTPGTYTPAADAKGASFQVVVANAGGGVGGAVTVTLLTAGDDYETGDTITLTGATIGGGSNITVTVATLVDPNVAVSSVKDWYLNTNIGSTGIALSAIGPRPGTSQYASDRGVSYDEVHIAVIDEDGSLSGAANTVIARYTYLSKIDGATNTEGAANYYETIINAQSDLIFTGASFAATIHPSNAGAGIAVGTDASALVSGNKFALVGLSVTDLAGGTDDYVYTPNEINNAYDLFLDTENTIVDFVLMGGSMSTEVDTKTKAGRVISIAASRKDCIAFVSPYVGNQIGNAGALSTQTQRDNTIAFFDGLTSTSYAVFDSGYKYYYDRFNDKYRYIACNGDVAGLCVSTSATLDDWYSPAGLNRGSLRNAIKLAYNPNKADRDALYQARINPIVSFPGSGITLFGDKTALASPSAFDRINVRRLFLNVEKRIGDLAKQVLFDLNDEITRGSFLSAATSYLNEVQARRGVTDYLVVCDETNNTADVIDRNEFVAELYIKPTRSINYITITFTATKTGVAFSEVIGG